MRQSNEIWPKKVKDEQNFYLNENTIIPSIDVDDKKNFLARA